MLSLNSANSVTKKFKSKRKIAGLEPRISCVRDIDSTTVPQRHIVREQILILNPIHASMISQNEMKNIVEEGRIRFLVAPHHGRESGYSKEMMDFIQPHSVFISDEWGASRTHRNYYSDPLGIRMPNGEIKKYFSTKSKGRILCIVDQVGNIYFDQYDPERNRYHPYEIQP